MVRRISILFAITAIFCSVTAAAAESPAVKVDFQQTDGTVGDQLPLTLTVTGTGSSRWEPVPLQESIGVFRVLNGDWRRGTQEEGEETWIWAGNLAAYETGELELPSFTIRLGMEDQVLEVATEPRNVTIESVLGGEDDGGELADLKVQAAVDPDYGSLLIALLILIGLLAASGAAWWLQRRFAGRLSAVPQPVDPFHRMPPHEWAYQALQELLRTGRSDHENAGPFFQEISRILKQYLGGRFRIELMECTTVEIPPALLQAGAGETSIRKAEEILLLCDMVKFAAHRPEPDAFRLAVEEAYVLVDETKPVEADGQGGT